MVKNVSDSLGWVGQVVEYKRRPNKSHKVWNPTVRLCAGVVLDVRKTKCGIELYINCIEHEEHKEMWKMSHLVNIMDRSDVRLRASDTDYAF